MIQIGLFFTTDWLGKHDMKNLINNAPCLQRHNKLHCLFTAAPPRLAGRLTREPRFWSS